MVDILPESELKLQSSFEVASHVIASPLHQEYTADRAVSKTLCGGKGALIAAIDGIGGGGQIAANAAAEIREQLSNVCQKIDTNGSLLTIQQGKNVLGLALYYSALNIKILQDQNKGNPDIHVEDIDSTVSVAITVLDPETQNIKLLTANLGDSQVYRFRPSTGELTQMTADHTVAVKKITTGMIPEERDHHVLTKSAIDAINKTAIDFGIADFEEGDIAFACTDGWSDNGINSEKNGGITRKKIVQDEFRHAFDPSTNKINPKKFAEGCVKKAQDIMNLPYGKNDDVGFSVMRLPRHSVVSNLPLSRDIERIDP